MKITKGQIRIIHTLKNRLGWDESQYRGFLMWNTDRFVTSSLELSYEEAERIIIKMRHKAVMAGVWQDRQRKYDELDGRENMATAAQLRKIEAIWAEVSRAKTEAERKKALRNLLWKKFRITDIRFLEDWQVRKVIKMLEAMKERKYGKKKEEATPAV
ncbi:hypothetical protein THER_1667 [Thermodesulfovibrio sp. N1]|uniref:phage protein GemA/Gp16 family protein n=1 Tax=unclassified Thermodesulfovibrio TaxID=2645936 RepID=UPI00083A1992|nr:MULTISPECIES: phage protein GemA/Gp16 family protein [unclassified Thermodesulfovibrio]MDI1471907.1 DUF1018 domain-containing protein [Thermodesulfovibrio sp. 1176]ODA43628.1 hypothetical protein THER_1667 [Thermodesulfovibrio sp. N1]